MIAVQTNAHLLSNYRTVEIEREVFETILRGDIIFKTPFLCLRVDGEKAGFR